VYWPRLTANSDPERMSAAERDALTMLLGERGLERAFQSETGYVAPRLGILADGTWWFFVTEPAPRVCDVVRSCQRLAERYERFLASGVA
jgi:hypothetical protein